MTEQILFRNVMKITEGSLEPFREAVRQAIEFVERNGPQIMVRTFIDEQEMRAVSFQLYRNCEDVLRHWEISDPTSGRYRNIAASRSSRFTAIRATRSQPACPNSSATAADRS